MSPTAAPPTAAPSPPRRKVTIPSLNAKMKKGEAIVQMAIYDYRSAVIADRLGVDILCVSDTGGMVLFGHRSTVSVTFQEVMSMSQAVDRGSKYGLRMVDMPYWSFHISPEQAVENAGRFVPKAELRRLGTVDLPLRPRVSGSAQPSRYISEWVR